MERKNRVVVRFHGAVQEGCLNIQNLTHEVAMVTALKSRPLSDIYVRSQLLIWMSYVKIMQLEELREFHKKLRMSYNSADRIVLEKDQHRALPPTNDICQCS